MADKKQIIENPAFTEQKPKYIRSGHLCDGGAAIERNKEYLPQHAYESDAQYLVRQSLATYKNHAAPIVTVFTSAAWRNPPERKLPPILDALKGDVDNLGTSANSFFRRSGEDAAKVGLSFIAVDQAAISADQNRTLADSQAAKMRPYFIKVPALKVPAWGYDKHGLTFVVIDETSTKVIDAFTEPEETVIFRVWDRAGWQTWKKGDDGNLAFEDKGAHPCGEVPVRPHYFRKKGEMVGESCISDVASLMLRAYMLENAYDKALFDTAFPQQYYHGYKADDIDGYVRASSNGLVNDDTAATTGFIEPKGIAYKALDAKVKSDEQSIREIALRMYKSDSKVGESYDAKKLDREQLNSQISVFSQGSEDLETWCWNMALKWLNESKKSGEIEISYNQDFDIEEISGDLIKALSEMRRNKDLSQQTQWEIMKEKEILPSSFEATEELARLKSEGGGYGDDI